MRSEGQTLALQSIASAGVHHDVVRFEPGGTIIDAAARRGIPVGALIKTMVVRRSSDDFTLVLVPGDRVIDWIRLRNHLRVRRLSLASDAEALTATGYRPGTITPLGVDRSLTVVADAAIAGAGRVSVGAGAPGVAIHLDADDLLELTGAVVGEVTKPAGFGPGQS